MFAIISKLLDFSVPLYFTLILPCYILQLIGYRWHYLVSLWNLFDLFILLVSWAEIYLSLSYTGPRVYVSSLRFLRMLRFLHSLKLIKVWSAAST